mgnify:FL=1
MRMEKEYLKLLDMACGKAERGRIEKIRDLSLIHLYREISLVCACDSNASNGEKQNDMHPNSYEESAVSVLKVPLMEVLASGAFPFLIVNNLCVEMNPSGEKIIQAMKAELQRCRLLERVAFTGSTEDNMETSQTGMGVTVIGLLDHRKSRLGKTRNGDAVVCVGIPQSGVRVPYSERDESVCDLKTMMELTECSFVHEILPIGSKGTLYEANQLADTCSLNFVPLENQEIDLMESAGSSTAVLVSLCEKDMIHLKEKIKKPVNQIGRIKQGGNYVGKRY